MADSSVPKILITGANGMIGTAMAKVLREKYGRKNVITSDVRKHDSAGPNDDPLQLCDITDLNQLDNVVSTLKITWLINLSCIVSAAGEANPQLAMKVNMLGFQNIMEVAKKHKLRVFSPSATAAFGPSTPKENTPDITIMRPTNIYGISKVHNELVGEYYHRKFGVDFRCLRFPSIMTDEGEKSGRVVDYIVEIFPAAVKAGCYTCDVDENGRLPFLYLEDCIDGTVAFMEAPEEKLKQRVYNVTNLSITPGELVAEIKKHVPKFDVDYKPNKVKTDIISQLPISFDDSNARRDWNWNPKYDLANVVAKIMGKLKANRC